MSKHSTCVLQHEVCRGASSSVKKCIHLCVYITRCKSKTEERERDRESLSFAILFYILLWSFYLENITSTIWKRKNVIPTSGHNCTTLIVQTGCLQNVTVYIPYYVMRGLSLIDN